MNFSTNPTLSLIVIVMTYACSLLGGLGDNKEPREQGILRCLSAPDLGHIASSGNYVPHAVLVFIHQKPIKKSACSSSAIYNQSALL